MGLIGLVKSFVRVFKNSVNSSDIKTDTGGGDNKTLQVFSPAGDDAAPLNDDFVVSTQVIGSNKQIAIGFLDPDNIGVAKQGEKRIYSRDNTNSVVAAVYLKNDGSIELTRNAGGSIIIRNDGAINLNGVTIDLTGSIDTNGTIKGNLITDKTTNVTLSTHVHPANGSPPTPGT